MEGRARWTDERADRQLHGWTGEEAAGSLDTNGRHVRRAGDWAVQAIEALSPEAQRELQDQLLASLQERQAHPSIIKRLTTSGWHHPMVRHEMIRFFADATFGPGWDKPTAEQLLEVAAQLGAEE